MKSHPFPCLLFVINFPVIKNVKSTYHLINAVERQSLVVCTLIFCQYFSTLCLTSHAKTTLIKERQNILAFKKEKEKYLLHVYG